VRDAPSEPADASLHPSTHHIRRAELLLYCYCDRTLLSGQPCNDSSLVKHSGTTPQL
jgi:hypothetical protein